MGAVISWFDGPLYNVLSFDVVESETLDLASELTEHGVEIGADITDHKRELAATAGLSTFVSMKPLTGKSLVTPGSSDGAQAPALLRFPAYSPPLLTGGVSNLANQAFSGPPPTQQSVSVLQFPIPVNRPEQVLLALEALRTKATFVEVNAPSWSLVDCQIETISVSRSAEDGQGLHFAIGFKRVRRVSSKRTAAAIPAEIKAKKKIDKGTKSGESVKLEDPSWLSSLLKAGGGGSFAPK